MHELIEKKLDAVNILMSEGKEDVAYDVGKSILEMEEYEELSSAHKSHLREEVGRLERRANK